MIASPASNVGKHVAQPLRARDRVELVAALDETGRQLGHDVGAERDDEHVGVVRVAIGRDRAVATGSIDVHRLLPERRPTA